MPKLQTYDPMAVAASMGKIKATRDLIEEMPVSTTFGVMDADQAKSEKRLRDIIENWDMLGIPHIPWIRADNTSINLTKVDLESMLAEILEARTLRGVQIHVEYQQHKISPPTLRQLDEWRQSYSLL